MTDSITTQPTSTTRRKELESFVRDLDPLQVMGKLPASCTTCHNNPSYLSCAEWSEQEVVDKYLKPINMEHLAKTFIENKINGTVLIGLEVNYMQH